MIIIGRILPATRDFSAGCRMDRIAKRGGESEGGWERGEVQAKA